MTLRREDWEQGNQTKLRALEAAKVASEALSLVRQAALPAERLVGLPEWDTYLQQLEARQKEDKEILQDIHRDLLEPDFLDAEHVIDLRHRMARVAGRMEARREAMSIPKEIIANARAAAERR